MNPDSGALYELGAELFEPAQLGDKLDMPTYGKRFEQLEREASADEIAALREEALVLVSAEVAQKIQLGNREQRRRKLRRKK